MDKSELFSLVSDEWLEILDTKELDGVIETIETKGDTKNITPITSKVFEFARLTDLNNIKVVILGQDPYPRAGDAHGLAFSCLNNVPASLKNIYKCLINYKLIKSMPTEGNLYYWAEQGVLLLNCALTTVVGKSNEHAKYWYDYTANLIKKIVDIYRSNKKPLIFMLWGNNAKRYESYILDVVVDVVDDSQSDSTIDKSKDKNKTTSKARDKTTDKNKTTDKDKNTDKNKTTDKDKTTDKTTNNIHVMLWSHPSPMAQQKLQFVNCDHFIKANKILTENNVDPIDWNQAPPQNDVEKGFQMNNKKQIIFTDGSCNPNKTCPNAIAGYATSFILGPIKDIVLYGNIKNRPNYANNQRAEGMAIYKALDYLKDKLYLWDEAVIVTDSKFYIDMFMEYMPSWEKDDIDFKEKKNPDIIIPMWKLYNELISVGKEIEFRHIKSHGKSRWGKEPEDSYKYFCYYQNQYVDELSKYARKNLNPGDDVITDLLYEDSESDDAE